jgi:hypothetical protein
VPVLEKKIQVVDSMMLLYQMYIILQIYNYSYIGFVLQNLRLSIYKINLN